MCGMDEKHPITEGHEILHLMAIEDMRFLQADMGFMHSLKETFPELEFQIDVIINELRYLWERAAYDAEIQRDRMAEAERIFGRGRNNFLAGDEDPDRCEEAAALC